MSSRLHVFLLVLLTVIPATAVASVLAITPTVDAFNPFESFGGTTISAVAIGSWTWIFKWMVQQLELQRQAHAQSQSELIRYMKEDHTLLVTTNQQLVSVLSAALSSLQQVTLATAASKASQSS